MSKGLALLLRLLAAIGKWLSEVSIIIFAVRQYYGLVHKPWYFYLLLLILMFSFLKLEALFNDTAKKTTVPEET